MENKIYLYYENDINDIVELDIGNIKEILYLGSYYAYKNKHNKLFYIILILKICLLVLFLIFLPIFVSVLLFIVFSFLINFLFSYNYNDIIIEQYIKQGYVPLTRESSDYLIEKGIYFKLI